MQLPDLISCGTKHAKKISTVAPEPDSKRNMGCAMKIRYLFTAAAVAATFTFGLITAPLAGPPPKPKIGVIMHDHGAPLEHNAESYYGMKYFLRHLVGMEVIPSFLVDGFPFDPFTGNWGVIMMDKTYPNTEVPWHALELTDAWGNDWSWMKYVDADPATPGVIDPIYAWVPASDPFNYGAVGHYRIFQHPWNFIFPFLDGFAEQDFWEFLGHDFRYKWLLKGGQEVYFDQVGAQRERIRDTLWEHNKKTLTGGDAGAPDSDKERYIHITWGIDPAFPNSDPKTSIHAQSLYDAVTYLVKDVGVDKIVVNEYFMFLSRMMNDGMDRMTVPHAIADLVADGYTAPEVVWAPDKEVIGQKVVPVLACSQWPPYGYPVGSKTIDMHVGGVALDEGYLTAVTDKVELELGELGDTTGDLVLFMSNHGTPTNVSHCWDSGNDYIHYSYKMVFTQVARMITTRLGGTEPVFGPESPGAVYGDDLKDIAILERDIQYATTSLPDGRTLKLYRISGQESGPDEDPGSLSLTPREALAEVVAAGNFSNVVDILYNFMGDSGDLLWDHRFDGYGHEDDQDPLALAAYEYCNPEVGPGELTFAIQDCSRPEYAGLEPYESDFVWDGVRIKITNATWAFKEKEKAVETFIKAGIKAASKGD